MRFEAKFRRRTYAVEENAVDRAVRYFFPEKANDRARARLAAEVATGGYTGASLTKRSLVSWRSQKGDADTVVMIDLPKLRERSRDLLRNAPLATGAVNTVVTSVVGPGLRMKSQIDRRILKMQDPAADEWEAITESEWRLWSESVECDVTRTLPFQQIQDLILRQILENGEVFTLLPNVVRPGSPYGLKLQVVESDRIGNKDGKPDSPMLAGGIAKDEYGAPVAYHIMDQHPGSAIYAMTKRTWTIVPAFTASGRRNLIHNFRILRPGQSRGVPYLAPVIDALKSLDLYTDAEIQAAVISSMFTVFIKSESGDTNLSPMAPTEETGGKESDEDFKMAPGAILNLAKGEEIQTAEPKRPNQAYDPFVMSILRQIGVALELPFEILIKHFTASYSASRGALLEAWRFFRARREWLAVMFCQPVFEAWMDEAVARGRVKAPGYFADPMIRKAYLGTFWVGPAQGQIDPQKEVDAAGKRIDLKLSTRTKETMELTGGDFEQNVLTLGKETKMLKEAGVWGSAEPSPPPPAGSDPGKEPDGNPDQPDKPEES